MAATIQSRSRIGLGRQVAAVAAGLLVAIGGLFASLAAAFSCMDPATQDSNISRVIQAKQVLNSGRRLELRLRASKLQY